MRRLILMTIGVACLLSVPFTVAAGTPEDPEILDAEGDVKLEGSLPLGTGADWADILALWFEATDEGETVMAIRLLDAPEIPPPGEVAAHIEINGTHYLTGFTTILFPFATPMHQGGFFCLAAADGTVDPADCATLSAVALSSDVLRTPLSVDVFGLRPGDVIETHGAYSGGWYLDLKTVFDDTDRGRPYTVPEALPAEGEGSVDAPPVVKETERRAADTEEDTPRVTAESPAILSTLLVGIVALLAMARRRGALSGAASQRPRTSPG